MMTTYAQSDAIPDKLLQPDGSVITSSGTLVTLPNAAGAKRYQLSDAAVDKWLQPDGSITTRNGTQVSPPAVERYLQRDAAPNKVLQPDGSFGALEPSG